MGWIRLDRINDMAVVGQFVLLALCVVASIRRRAHLPLVLWLGISCAYALLGHYYITPVLSHLPRPYHGLPRVLMHVGQALYVGTPAAFSAALWRVFKVPSRWLPAPFFIVFCALVVLIDGYAHAEVPGLYRIATFQFTSNTVYTIANLLNLALTWTIVLPRISRGFFESRDEHEVVIRLVLLIELAFSSIEIGVPRVWGDVGAGHVRAAIALVEFTVAVGLYAALLANGLQGVWNDTLAERFVRLRRFGTMKRIQSRLAHARLLSREHLEHGSDVPAIPYFEELSQRVGRARDAERVLLTDADLARTLNLVAAVAGTMHEPDARIVLAHANEMLDGAAPWGDDWPIEWERLLVSQQGVMRRQPLLGPITLIMLSALQGVRLATAQSAVSRTAELLGTLSDARDGYAAPA